jgi:hypothetical protein
MNSFFTPHLAQEQASGAQAFRHPGAVFFNRFSFDIKIAIVNPRRPHLKNLNEPSYSIVPPFVFGMKIHTLNIGDAINAQKCNRTMKRVHPEMRTL